MCVCVCVVSTSDVLRSAARRIWETYFSAMISLSFDILLKEIANSEIENVHSLGEYGSRQAAPKTMQLIMTWQRRINQVKMHLRRLCRFSLVVNGRCVHANMHSIVVLNRSTSKSELIRQLYRMSGHIACH